MDSNRDIANNFKAKSQGDVLAKLEDRLRMTAEWHDTDFEGVFRDTLGFIKNGTMCDDDIANINCAAILRCTENLDNYFYIAMAYYCRALIAANDCDLNLAWALISESSYYAGLVFQEAATKTIKSLLRNDKDNGLKGSEKTKENRTGATRREVARLLVEKRPKNGWRDAGEAAEAILADIESFVHKNSVNLSIKRLRINLERWIEKDADVFLAFSDFNGE